MTTASEAAPTLQWPQSQLSLSILEMGKGAWISLTPSLPCPKPTQLCRHTVTAEPTGRASEKAL